MARVITKKPAKMTNVHVAFKYTLWQPSIHVPNFIPKKRPHKDAKPN